MMTLSEYDEKKIQETVTALVDRFDTGENLLDQWAIQYGTGHIAHYTSLIENIRLIAERNNISCILDVGSAPGHIPVILRCAGLEVEVVDIFPERSKQLYDEYDIAFHKVDIEKQSLPYADGQLEMVVFSEVIEHLRINPMHAVREIFRVLKPGGMCLLSTPQITPLMRWRFLFGVDYQDDIVAEFEKVERLGHMGHIRLYSEREVRHIVGHVGFSVERINTGGKFAGIPGDRMAQFLRWRYPEKMRTQIYIWLRKTTNPRTW
jgi:SAM-dependent methyltransferase